MWSQLEQYREATRLTSSVKKKEFSVNTICRSVKSTDQLFGEGATVLTSKCFYVFYK